jgi:hypothetical protein
MIATMQNVATSCLLCCIEAGHFGHPYASIHCAGDSDPLPRLPRVIRPPAFASPVVPMPPLPFLPPV